MRIHASHFVVGPHTREGTIIADVPHATVADLHALNDDVPKGVELQAGWVTAAAHLVVDMASLAASGSVSLSGDHVRLRLADSTLEGDVRAKVSAVRRRNVTDLSGTTLAFDSEPRPKTFGWWARVGLSDTELRLSGGAALRSHVHVSAQNGSPAAAMIAANTALPRWVIDAVPMNDLRADADVRVASSDFEVRSLSAHGDSDTIRAEYTSRRGSAAWALLVEAGPLHAGFDSADGKSQLVLFGVSRWFDDEVESLKAREDRRD